MYESLKKRSDGFHLYIFAFDDKSYELLQKLNLDFVTVVSLQEFEDEELLALKDSRSIGEYCWTCTPSVIKYSIQKYNLESCTYLDADLYFFSNPSCLIKEMGSKSVLITEHRYTKKYDQSSTSGIYCVQFMTFKNDHNGMNILNWWQKACNEWCYARFENGKFGDQKYLDDWLVRFEGVHVLQNLGGGIAPWNMQKYDFVKNNNELQALVKGNNTTFEVVFFHFHNFKLVDSQLYALTDYQLFDDCKSLVYQPYIEHLQIVDQDIKCRFHFEVYERKIPKNFYMVYQPDKNSYLHS